MDYDISQIDFISNELDKEGFIRIVDSYVMLEAL